MEFLGLAIFAALVLWGILAFKSAKKHKGGCSGCCRNCSGCSK